MKTPAIFKNKIFYNACIVPLVIIISGFIRSICVKIFIEPHNFAPGGATGIATMLNYATGFETGWIYLIINAPLIVIAFIFIGKSFAIKTGAAIGMSSLSMILLDYVDFTKLVVENPVLSALASGSLGGIGLALMLKIGGSTGGSDIIAVCIQKKLSATNVSWFIYAIDAMIVFVSAFVYRDGLNPVLISLVEMFCLAKMTDVITSGFKTALKYEIITKDPEPLSQDILHKLHRGVTCTKVMGMYSHDERYMLTCIIRKHQLSEFNKLMQSYPDTFAYLSNTREVVGLGFSRAVELKEIAADAEENKKRKADKKNIKPEAPQVVAPTAEQEAATPATPVENEAAAFATSETEQTDVPVDTPKAEEQNATEE
ncbi:MAG: YitT family protein [Clostridiales bacterium]|nr:YitT family protein [Clostridiales bacterium]